MKKKFFKKKETNIPDFEFLEKYEYKDKYFGRNNIWNWLNEENIYLIELNTLRHITMDAWFQHIFLSAEGNITLKEFVLNTAKQYSKKEGIPKLLDQTIVECFEELLEKKYIKISEIPFQLEKNKKITLEEFSRLNKNI